MGRTKEYTNSSLTTNGRRTIIDAFKDLRNEECANKKIELADKFNKQLESGELNEWEYKDLMQDLTRTDEIMDKANAMKMKAAVEKAISLALKFV